jgi:hypothetical protein
MSIFVVRTVVHVCDVVVPTKQFHVAAAALLLLLLLCTVVQLCLALLQPGYFGNEIYTLEMVILCGKLTLAFQ